MGEFQVPAEAYYGAQTARAVANFPVSGIGFSPAIHSRSWSHQASRR